MIADVLFSYEIVDLQHRRSSPMCCEKQNFLILNVDRRWSPMIADASKNLVLINLNSSAMNYDLMKTRLKRAGIIGIFALFKIVLVKVQ